MTGIQLRLTPEELCRGRLWGAPEPGPRAVAEIIRSWLLRGVYCLFLATDKTRTPLVRHSRYDLELDVAVTTLVSHRLERR